jgi:hypothetical protein
MYLSESQKNLRQSIAANAAAYRKSRISTQKWEDGIDKEISDLRMKPTDKEFRESLGIYQLRVMNNLGILSFSDKRDFGGLTFVISRTEEKRMSLILILIFRQRGVSILFNTIMRNFVLV